MAKRSDLLRVLKLGIVLLDHGTGECVTLTHRVIDTDGHVTYFAQPNGLDVDGAPVAPIHACESRFDIRGSDAFEMVTLPIDVLGKVVTDKASGFTGVCIRLIQHASGCVHVMIQPKGRTEKGRGIDPLDFDIRRCESVAIKPMSGDEFRQDTKSKPSPSSGCKIGR